MNNRKHFDAERESRCKTFCKYRRKHKCAKHGGRIIHAPCDPAYDCEIGIQEWLEAGAKEVAK